VSNVARYDLMTYVTGVKKTV